MRYSRRMKRILLLPGMILIPSFLVLAGGDLSGTVKDSVSGKALSGAHVLLKGIGQGQVTDASGRYHFQGLPDGTYSIRVTFLGYRPEEKTIKINSKQSLILDFNMIATTILADEIEIIGLVHEREETSVPMRLDLITASMIQNNPGLAITKTLDYISGVNLSNTMGIFSNNTVVSMRGLSGNDQGRTLVLIDDIPMNKSDEGTVNWHLVNRDNISRIEVTKGPVSALYGSNSMGGVIHIRTPRPEKVISGTTTLEYGTFNTLNFGYTISGIIHPVNRRNGIFYNLNGFYTRSDGYNAEIQEYLENSDTFTVNTFIREADIGAKLGYKFRDSSSIEGGASFYDDKRGRGIQIYEVEGAWERHATWQSHLRYQGSRGIFSWTVLGYILNEHFERMNEYMKEAEYNLYLVKSDRFDGGGTAMIKAQPLKSHTITAGFNIHLGAVDGQDIYYTSTDLIRNTGKNENYALFLQDEMSFNKRNIQVNAGLRLDYAIFHDGLFTIENPSYSIEYMLAYQDTLIPRHTWMQISPKLSVQYHFSPTARIYLSVTRGFRAPNLDDLCRTGKKRNGFKIANPDLNPEYIDNFETGTDVVLFKKILVASSIYYSIGNDFMYYVSTGDSVNMGYKISPVFQKKNISRVDIIGAELDLDYNPVQWLSFYVNYSFSHSTITKFEATDTLVDKDLEGKFLTDVPMHKVTAGATFSNRYVSANLLFKYIGSRWINDQNEADPVLQISKYPAYSTFSMRLWHTFFKRMTVALNIDNIFNVLYIDDRLQESPGRIIMAEVSVTF